MRFLTWFYRTMTVFMCGVGAPVWAQSDASALEARCWGSYVAQRTRIPNDIASQQVEFANLWNGQRVLSPFKVAFAVRGMGVVPAKHPAAKTGHHHLLVDQRLPLNVQQGLPFDDHHKHFGGGQTSTVLDLAPGKHRLRLLFADAGHVPYFVYSPEIEVEVVARRSELQGTQASTISATDFEHSCALWYEDHVTRPDPVGKVAYFLNLREGDVVKPRFNVQLGVEGYGVCSASVEVEKTGHFDLQVFRDGDRTPVRALPLVKGQTQADLELVAGMYELRLQLRNHDGLPLGEPEKIKIEVGK